MNTSKSFPSSRSNIPTATTRGRIAESVLPTREGKIQAWHLERLAIVYVRQSTPQQVSANHESAQRQYALARRAVELGWPQDRVLTIDKDQGRSGASGRTPGLSTPARRGQPGPRRTHSGPGDEPAGTVLP
jgi:hypothetical protein